MSGAADKTFQAAVRGLMILDAPTSIFDVVALIDSDLLCTSLVGQRLQSEQQDAPVLLASKVLIQLEQNSRLLCHELATSSYAFSYCQASAATVPLRQLELH